MHPLSHDELSYQGGAGPEPTVESARGSELALSLGMNDHPSSEWAGREAEEGEGIIGISTDELAQRLRDQQDRDLGR